MILQSLRLRLQLWHGLLLVIVLTAFGVTAWRTASRDQLRRVDQDLEQHLGELFRPPPFQGFGQGGPREMPDRMPPPPNGMGPNPRMGLGWMKQRVEELPAQDVSQPYYFRLYDGNGVLVAASTNGPAGISAPDPPPQPEAAQRPPFPGPPGITQQRTRGAFRELVRHLPHNEALLIGRSIEPEFAELRRLAFSLGAAGGALLLIGLLGGWWLASRAIKPIGAISETASRIAGGDLSRRILVEDTDSELGQLAIVLNSTFSRLQDSFERQARFTSDASHELRTPITVMLSQIQLTLSRERNTAEYRDALLACQRAAQRMRRMTESLLAISRTDAGQIALHKEPFELSTLVTECVELTRPLAWDRNIEISCDLPPITATGDAAQFAQVVINLLANAIQFNRENGQVCVSVSRAADSAALTVADTGEGIAESDLPHIFERFFRVDKARSNSQGRSGLGLAISQAIVLAHGGSITVSSQPGQGTAFTVVLPDTPTSSS